MRAAFVTHADCLKHEMGASHPERPARLAAIEDELIASGIGQHLERYDAPLATDEQLARVHPIEYVKAIREVAPREGTIHLDPDTAMNRWSLQAALRAAGAAVLATDLVLQKKPLPPFAAGGPPGITPAARGRWDFASSTTSRSPQGTGSRRTAGSGGR